LVAGWNAESAVSPIDPVAALDPATVAHIGVYALDGQVSAFRLVLESISAVR
jgi:hypothetical protein